MVDDSRYDLIINPLGAPKNHVRPLKTNRFTSLLRALPKPHRKCLLRNVECPRPDARESPILIRLLNQGHTFALKEIGIPALFLLFARHQRTLQHVTVGSNMSNWGGHR